MKMQQVLIVVAIVALVITVLMVGCGKKTQPDMGEGGPPAGEAGPMHGAGGPMPGGMPGAGGPMPGAGGPMPGAAAPTMGADADSLVDEGMAAKAAGDYDRAESKLRDAIAADITNEDAHWGLAWILAGLRQTDEAISEFQEVIELTIDEERRSEAQAAISRLKK